MKDWPFCDTASTDTSMIDCPHIDTRHAVNTHPLTNLTGDITKSATIDTAAPIVSLTSITRHYSLLTNVYHAAATSVIENSPSINEVSSVAMSKNDLSTNYSVLSADNCESDPYPISDIDRLWYTDIQQKVVEVIILFFFSLCITFRSFSGFFFYISFFISIFLSYLSLLPFHCFSLTYEPTNTTRNATSPSASSSRRRRSARAAATEQTCHHL